MPARGDVARLRIDDLEHVTDPAAARLADAAASFRVRSGTRESDDVLAGTALLALGMHAAVRDALRDPSSTGELLLLARWLDWTGDLSFITPRWPAVRDAARAAVQNGLDGFAARDAASALERTAADVGDHAFAAELRSIIRTAAPQPEPLQLAVFREGRLNDAAGTLRSSFVDAEAPPPDLADDARGIVLLARGLLGLEPDAVRGRIRFAPRILPGIGAFGFSNLRLADALLSGAVAVERDRISVTIRQDAGAIPLTVLLEPCLAGRITACRVDGRHAELAPRPLGDGTVVPVQLVLDHERHLDVEIEPPGAAGADGCPHQ